MGGLGVNAGGFSKGASSIWPGGKPPSSKDLAAADEVFQSHKEVGAPTTKAPGASEVAAPKSAQDVQQTQQAQQTKAPTVVKQLEIKDVYQQLARSGIEATKENMNIASFSLMYGVEITEENLRLIKKLKKGRNSNSAIENAVLLVSKGLGESVDDVSILQNLMKKNSTISQSLKNLEAMQQKMSGLLQRSLSDYPGLQSFLSTFDEFNDELKKIKKINQNNSWLAGQEDLLDDLFAMKGFLSGLAQKGVLKGSFLTKYLQALGALKENLLAQAILSQNSIKQPIGLLEAFHYFQVPNPLAAQAMIEILLRKQVSTRQSKKDAQNKDNDKEKIIINMESEELGKITIIVTVMGFKVWCMVYSDREEAVHHVNSFRNELAQNLAKFQYKIEEFKTTRKKINIKKFIAPSQDISEIKRVQTEI